MPTDKTGKSLEMAVTRIQQLLDPQSVVTHNEQIVDRLGNRRQFDVVIRGVAAGRGYLAVVEAKDWSKKIGTPQVEAFVVKAQNVNANIVLMVSRKGFSEPALRLARDEGVGTLSLLPDDPLDAGFTIGLECYSVEYEWSGYEVSFQCPPQSHPPQLADPGTLELEGKRVMDWFLRELVAKHSDATQGVLMEALFREPVRMRFDNGEFRVSRIEYKARRSHSAKRGMVQMNGEAYWDWETNSLKWPIGGTLRFAISSDMIEKWPQFLGDVPTPETFRGLVVQQFSNPNTPPHEVIELRDYF